MRLHRIMPLFSLKYCNKTDSSTKGRSAKKGNNCIKIGLKKDNVICYSNKWSIIKWRK